ncbi:hypothetical protein EUGRSUZ_A00028 [Eucalyptus grandis]|uniref:Uncharacterized protein n=2 Tax=Eucalyptus grandis TaxID=71139 RepID=A0ACC3M0L8_EUCGR|nr:hypothetical protein EUGRSUZ_A00028 [Eucalyptus grandis]
MFFHNNVQFHLYLLSSSVASTFPLHANITYSCTDRYPVSRLLGMISTLASSYSKSSNESFTFFCIDRLI